MRKVSTPTRYVKRKYRPQHAMLNATRVTGDDAAAEHRSQFEEAASEAKEASRLSRSASARFKPRGMCCAPAAADRRKWISSSKSPWADGRTRSCWVSCVGSENGSNGATPVS